MLFSVQRLGHACLAAAVLAFVAPLAASQTQVASPTSPVSRPPSAATAADKLPGGREVIDRYVKAIGGRDAVLSHKSMHTTGTYSVPSAGMVGTMETFAAARPDRVLQKVAVPGVGEILTGYDGQHGWSVNPMMGPMLQQGKELEQAKIDADFYGELRDPAKYTSVTTVEKTVFENRPSYKVRLVRVDGTEDFDFYDVETGLRNGSMNTRESPMGRVTTTSIEGEYKKFGNVLQPTTLTVKAMGIEQKVTVNAIDYDTVPASAFEPPDAVKALIK